MWRLKNIKRNAKGMYYVVNESRHCRMMSSEPDYGAALGLINHLPTEQLRDLVNNDDKLTDLVKDLPEMKNLANEQEMLLAANKSLAEFNLSLEPKLSQNKAVWDYDGESPLYPSSDFVETNL
ncbi:hypothetical protein E2C01_007167 [Portunus trituberculatus]|uniref:VPS37 C-terminal domain-containing protein n=1 Tax=Portunus trituberculatus TaxID=210409 RepID=A0A5B7D3Q3_PORTR|nr:hypothetical protein [Portunus trituberculatus]